MKNIIQELEQRIADELTPVDREQAFRDMLDECYSLKSVGGPFEHMQASAVLEEIDPIAFRCGVNDHADGENWVEVGTETYDQDECEGVKQEMVDELESEIADLEEELENNDDEEGTEWKESRQLQIGEANVVLAELEKHSF